MLDRATAADLAEHLTIKRLEFLHRLLAGLATRIEDSAIPAFLDEARALGLTETDGIRLLLEQQLKQALAEHGPEVIERTATGHNRRHAVVGKNRLAVETSPRLQKCPFWTDWRGCRVTILQQLRQLLRSDLCGYYSGRKRRTVLASVTPHDESAAHRQVPAY